MVRLSISSIHLLVTSVNPGIAVLPFLLLLLLGMEERVARGIKPSSDIASNKRIHSHSCMVYSCTRVDANVCVDTSLVGFRWVDGSRGKLRFGTCGINIRSTKFQHHEDTKGKEIARAGKKERSYRFTWKGIRQAPYIMRNVGSDSRIIYLHMSVYRYLHTRIDRFM